MLCAVGCMLCSLAMLFGSLPLGLVRNTSAAARLNAPSVLMATA